MKFIAQTVFLVKQGDEFHHLSGEKVVVGGYNPITPDGNIFFTVQIEENGSFFYLCRVIRKKIEMVWRKNVSENGLHVIYINRRRMSKFFPTKPTLQLIVPNQEAT